MNLELRQETRQVLSQQMQQSMQLLQMSTQELDAYLRELAMENPMLEEAPPSASFISGAVRRTAPEDGEREDVIPDERRGTLREYVREQVLGLRVPELMRRELLYLCNEMDERGYLPEDCAELELFSHEPERCRNAVLVFQSLEPPGVGARNLGECLEIQLRRMESDDEVAYALCERYLEPLAKGRTNQIARELGVSEERVLRARALISTLSPRPSNGFAEKDAPGYILPDVVITQTESGLEISTAEKYLPSFRIDGFYASLMGDPGLNSEEKTYLSEKFRQASWALRCVERRREMLLGCTRAILEVQKDFFTCSRATIKPYTMTELADSLGVNVSTVSRAVRGKYLSCESGTYPMSYFFQRESASGSTGGGVLNALMAIIAEEDKAHPLSDRVIAERMAADGFSVSRRTVAKYREEAGIPPASARRLSAG